MTPRIPRPWRTTSRPLASAGEEPLACVECGSTSDVVLVRVDPDLAPYPLCPADRRPWTGESPRP